MKKRSIQIRTTILYALLLLVMVTLTVLIFRTISISVLQKTIRSYLVSATDENANKISYAVSREEADKVDPGSILIAHDDAYLAIDDDFMDIINDVTCSLYTQAGEMLYGENPLARQMEGAAFDVSRIYQMASEGTTYYVYDRKLIVEGVEDLWIRGMVPLTESVRQMSDITRILIFILPFLFVLALTAGFFLTGRMLKPIRSMEKTAEEITKGSDLTRRIDVGKGEGELYDLAGTFNEMLDKLENAFAAEQRFTSDASHELRTPMSVIMAQAELTLSADRTEEEYRDALRVIRRQGGRMNALINDMLDYTRMEQRRENYPLVPMDLSQLAGNIADDMALLREKNITLTADIAPDISVMGNRVLLTRLIQNLISNAYRYGREDGRIEVSLKRLPHTEESAAEGVQHVALSVRDDGMGIREEELDKIFDRFYRADASRSTKGNGLGLSMVKKIAELHDAELSVESTEGVGSTFTVVFSKVVAL